MPTADESPPPPNREPGPEDRSTLALHPFRALVARGLAFYWRGHVATLLGMIVGGAALTGALVVGDSIRASLRRLTMERLGAIDHALLAPRFLRQGLAEDLARDPAFLKDHKLAAPIILMPASAENPDTSAFAGKVNLIGADERFWKFAPAAAESGASHGDAAPPPPPLQAREAAINSALAREIGAKAGDPILVRVEKPDPVPAESVAGRKVERGMTLRLTIARVVPDEALGRFSLVAAQRSPLNVWVPLDALQDRTAQKGMINAILADGGSAEPGPTAGPPKLQRILDPLISPEDMGLKLRLSSTDPPCVVVESAAMLFDDPLIELASRLGRARGATPSPVLTNLAISIEANGKSIPYSTVAAVDPAAPPPLGGLRLVDGAPAPPPGTDGIFLNDWAAADLGAKPGDKVAISYYVEAQAGRLATRRAEFALRGVVPMAGLAADASLTPDYPGVQKSQRMRDWDPPFPVDLGKIRDADEDYWKKHRATPKAFIALDRGMELWTSRFGKLTSIRLAPPEGKTAAELMSEIVAARPYAQGPPGVSGLVFQPVKAQGLAASAGATDFSGLFIGFSLFLIASALILVRLFFTLGVEARAREIGLLLAVGYDARRARRLVLAEGAALAGVGAVTGALAGVGYAALMLHGLRTWWGGAVGTNLLWLHASPVSLAIGAALGFLCGLFSVWLAARGLAKADPARLLAGGSGATLALSRSDDAAGFGATAGHPRAMIAGHTLLALAIACMIGTAWASAVAQAGLFYGAGSALLAASLCYLSVGLKRGARRSIRPGARAPLAALGVSNAARHPGRSLMTIGLVASAVFIIVAVAAYRHRPGAGRVEKSSGNGGFALMAESAQPILQDLNDAKGRADIGLQLDAALLEGTRFFPLRASEGEDASCRNLYRPSRPRVLGAPTAFIQRGGFAFQGSTAKSAEEKANPWLLLDRAEEADVIPAVGDFNTVMWILHLGLGKDLEFVDGAGKMVRLRLVALLQGSALQGELVVSEDNFRRLFPREAGYKTLFVETPSAKAPALSRALEAGLRDHGLDAFPTQARIDDYLSVENAYLSTFQALGGLGLLLGTAGLAAVMLRNVAERRGELALLRAFGFGSWALARLVLAENAFLVVLGLASGAASALLAVTPSLVSGASGMEWAPLAATLAAAMAVGLAGGAAAVWSALRAPILEALRAP